MKELSIEEKARAYDEALERARLSRLQLLDIGEEATEIEYIFPELVESEDEKIRKALIDGFTVMKESKNCGKTFSNHNIPVADILAWLEKQGEQNLEWSKEENDKISTIVAWIKDYPRLAKFNEEAFVKANNYAEWLKSIRNKYILKKQGYQKPQRMISAEAKEAIYDKPVEPFDKYEGLTNFERTLTDICIGWIGEESGWKQYIKDNADVLLRIAAEKFNSVQVEQKPAWGEEDSVRLQRIIDFLWHNRKGDTDAIYQQEQDIDWLKSLKDRVQPKNNWKPSEDQMDALYTYIYNPQYFNTPDPRMELVISIYEDLKKLMEE